MAASSHLVCFDESSVRFEPPDTIVVVAAGRIKPETIRQINSAVAEHARGKPYLLQLVDISHLEGISTESRKATEQASEIEPGRGIALFGGSMALRIIAGSILRLIRLVRNRLTLDPVRVFDTEAQARAWLAKRRRDVRRALSLPDMPDLPGSSDSGSP